MARPRSHSLAAHALGALAGVALSIGASTGAMAMDDDGVAGFFQRMFAPERQDDRYMQPRQREMDEFQARQRYGYGYEQGRHDYVYGYAPQEAWGQAPDPGRYGARRAPGRYVALPEAAPLSPLATERQFPLDMSQGAAAAFSKDPTLMPGDIVMTENGPRVFEGNPDTRHDASDFASIGRSQFIDSRTRLMLVAMTLPQGAQMPSAPAKAVASKGAAKAKAGSSRLSAQADAITGTPETAFR